MSHLLELLGQGLDGSLEETLGRFFWGAGRLSVTELAVQAAQHPDWPDVQCQLGLAYLRAAKTGQAIEPLARACRQKPDFLAARLALASALTELGLHDKALGHLRLANQTHAGEPAILFALGYLLEKLDRADEAAGYYREALAAKADLLAARHRLAAIALFHDRLEEATDQYEYLVRYDPGDTHARIALAQLYHRRGLHGQAVEQFGNAIAMEPENWALVDEQTEALAADGQLREAIERLEEMIAAQGDLPDLHLRLADLYGQVGDDPTALAHFERAMELQPGYLEAAVKLGTHHLTQGRWAEASEAFAQASELNDDLLTAYVGLGVAQAAGGDQAAAIQSFELAGAVEPNSTLLVREMARLQLKAALGTAPPAGPLDDDPDADAPALGPVDDPQGDDLLQLQLTRHAEQVRDHPGFADVRYRYGVLLRAEGRLVEALEQFDAALEINPTYTKAIIKKGLTLQDLGRIDQAIETLATALELHPKYVDLHYRLGLLYTEGRLFEQAVQHLEATSREGPDNRTIRANLALALQNMGLMDRAAATWRSLARIHDAAGRHAGDN